MHVSYLSLMVIILGLGLLSQSFINRQYKQWSRVPISTGFTGAQAARLMLDRNGLQNVGIERIPGTLTDNFDPRTNVLRLSESSYNSTSVAATATGPRPAHCAATSHAASMTPKKGTSG